MVTIYPDDEKRFWDKVNFGKWDDCWYWNTNYSVSTSGYGRMNIRGHIFHSNQLSWMIYNKSPIPNGMFVLHSKTCVENAERCFGDGKKSRLCCNPYHLRLGTKKENSKDASELGRIKGTFPKGIHKYFGESHGQHKLSSEQVKRIRSDPRKHTLIAKEFGVVQSTISRIKQGLRRKDG